ncbi:winged helix-turn-helix transcriptional regulator [Streptomyces sp. NBC_00989]|uniref:winged helix-turn-helix transcriptional regulator n=1 Tax=Streptomyces sp. NBC_00989 TaxID=2903705 RepID=UPI00386CFB8D|nr:helix-turn-helix transcriptional regulator [Streptomyces sp. NBC_00989]
MADASEGPDLPGGPTPWNRDSWDIEPDSIALALEVLNPRAAGKILKEAFYGTRRFEDFQRRCELSRTVLSTRLRDLVAIGVLEKRPYREPGARERDEYRLTDKGLSLAPTLVALNAWAEHWLVDAPGPTVTLIHRDCGAPVHSVIACTSGHEIAAVRDITATPGPGARPARPGAADAPGRADGP